MKFLKKMHFGKSGRNYMELDVRGEGTNIFSRRFLNNTMKMFIINLPNHKQIAE